MQGARPSRTAQGVAAERALLTDLGVLDDGYARGMLAPPMAAIVAVLRRLPRRTWGRSLTLAGLAARVRWFDAQVARALDDGIDQVATVGGGYDSRAWRCARPGVAFFELDHPATQRDKAMRAPGPGPTYVEADLTTTSAAEALTTGGLDPGRAVLVVLEGVTMYLDEDVVFSQLADLEVSLAPGSRLVLDTAPPPSPGRGATSRQRRLQRLARAGSGEGLRFTAEPMAAAGLVGSAGWEAVDVTGLRAAARVLVPASAGLPVDAIDDRKALLAAERR